LEHNGKNKNKEIRYLGSREKSEEREREKEKAGIEHKVSGQGL
jgi:hypothetical protein